MTTPPNRNAPPPRLKTLHTKPTWHNRAGQVDRSACFIITASKLWRMVPEDGWTYRLGKPPRHTRGSEYHSPPCVARRLKGKCDRTATLTLTARHLWLMHKHQQPYPLQGDHRTTKSNAMKTGVGCQVLGVGSITQSQKPTRRTHTPPNPNRGVGFSMGLKMLGLDCMWDTTLRIERIVQHAKLRQHFLVCPACGSETAASHAGAMPTTAPGRGPAVSKLPQYPGRVTKLYLPLCTPQEYEDAKRAHLWLTSNPQALTHPNRPLSKDAIQLINRYGELFAPRQLRCRQCLGLRYGEVKPNQSTKRQRVPHAAKPSGALAHASCSDKSSVPIRPPRPTEQTLFLQNLPKLLAKPTPGNALPGLPMGENKSEALAEGQTNLSTIKNHQSPNDLPEPMRDQLLLHFAGQHPAFKKLRQVKEQSP